MMFVDDEFSDHWRVRLEEFINNRMNINKIFK